MEFREIEVPVTGKRGRPALSNPYVGQFPTSADKALETTVDAPENSTEVKRLIRQARTAAKALGLTARVAVDEFAENRTNVAAWTVPRKSTS